MPPFRSAVRQIPARVAPAAAAAAILLAFCAGASGAGTEEALAESARKLAENRWEEALASARLALSFDSEDVRGHIAAGKALMGSGRIGEAIESFRTALIFAPAGMDPEDDARDALVECLIEKANGERDSGDLEAARDSLNDALVADIDRVDAILLLAGVLEELGDFVEAQREYGIAIGKDPGNASALRLAALFHLKRREEETARELLESLSSIKAPGAAAERAFAEYELARLHVEEGARGKALVRLRRAAKLDPQNGEIAERLSELESFRRQAEEVAARERLLGAASLGVVLLYLAIFIAARRFLKSGASKPAQ